MRLVMSGLDYSLAPIALIVGIILLMFIKTKASKTIGDIFVGFGVLFVGLSLMTDGVKPLIGTAAFVSFVKFLQNPLMGILFGLVLTVIVQSSSATVGMLQTVASVPGSGITFAMAYPVIMGINPSAPPRMPSVPALCTSPSTPSEQSCSWL